MELNIHELKKELRTEIKNLKSQFSASELITMSDKIFASFEHLSSNFKYNTILAYWSLDDEVHTHQWIQKYYKQKSILLPVIQNNELKVKHYTGIENMQSVPPFGIKEPIGNVLTDLNQIEIILVPGMAFDRQGYRMGRGKGYYDRFLPKTQSIRIGICFNFQLMEKIPVNEYDAQMDYIITEKETVIINKKAL